jgi:hypothetical protein
MERTIGNLGEEIKQHSNPFSNLAQRGLHRCQVNALKAMIPDIEPVVTDIPRGGRDLGDGYVLLTAMDNTLRPVQIDEGHAIFNYLTNAGEILSEDWVPLARRWARIRLPNGQIARSSWKESLKPLSKCRSARNVKVSISYICLWALLIYILSSQLITRHAWPKSTFICF